MLERTSPAVTGSAPPAVAGCRSQFSATPPRRFMYPALLLLLAERPSHGYLLAEGLRDLGLGQIDRHSVYRALADLAADGLVHSWDEPPAAGSTRHVYELTGAGIRALEAWMSIVAEERAMLDTVLRRFWYCSAHTLEPAADAGSGGLDTRATANRLRTQAAGTARVEFAVAGDRSCLTVEVRSNVGPIAFSTSAVRGRVTARVEDGLVSVGEPPRAHLELDLGGLSSGNPLYDAELLRRVDARRHPLVTLDLTAVERLGEGNCYEATGDLTMRGTTRVITGSVTATVQEAVRKRRTGLPTVDRRLTVAGEQLMDVRQWAIEPPAMPLLRIYPDVRLHLHLEADSLEPEV